MAGIGRREVLYGMGAAALSSLPIGPLSAPPPPCRTTTGRRPHPPRTGSHALALRDTGERLGAAAPPRGSYCRLLQRSRGEGA